LSSLEEIQLNGFPHDPVAGRGRMQVVADVHAI